MRIAMLCIAVLSQAAPAAAAEVTLTGIVANSCILTLTSQGALRTSSSGTIVGSEQPGGSPAILSLVASGLSPTITFGAPALVTSPGGMLESPTVEIRYTSNGGANQAYTSGASSHQPMGLLETYSIDGKLTSSKGFAAGTYTMRTLVTCQQ